MAGAVWNWSPVRRKVLWKARAAMMWVAVETLEFRAMDLTSVILNGCIPNSAATAGWWAHCVLSSVRRAFAIWFALSVGIAIAHAQANTERVGKRVLQKTSTIEVRYAVSIPKLPEARSPFDPDVPAPRTGARVPADPPNEKALTKSTRVPKIYQVDSKDGDWLLLTDGDDGDILGWVRSDQLIPVENAIGFFTKQIPRIPKMHFRTQVGRWRVT